MTDAPHLMLRMAQNNAWANARLYGAIDGMDRDAFLARRPGFFPSLKATLNHIHQVDLFYVDALEQGARGRKVYTADEIEDPATLAAEQAAVDARLIRFCKMLVPGTLTEMRRTERREGMVEERVDALLLHLFQHQVHHRGQAHVQIQDAGLAPPQLDEFHLDYDRHPTAAGYDE